MKTINRDNWKTTLQSLDLLIGNSVDFDVLVDFIEQLLKEQEEKHKEEIREALDRLTIWIDKCHLLQNEKQLCLKGCQEINGLPYCKNCGLGYEVEDYDFGVAQPKQD